MYRLYQFGEVILPEYDPTDPIDSASAREIFYSLPGGGAYDIWQDGLAPLSHLETLTKRCTIHAESQAVVQIKLDQLKRLVGQRKRLIAQTARGERWLWARLKQVKGSRETDTPLAQPIDLIFATGQTAWYGDYRHLSYSVAGERTLWLTNNGTAPVTDVVIKLINPSANFRIVGYHAISGDTSDIQLSGISGEVIIDCGAMSVTENGTDSYHKLTLNEAHSVTGWLLVEANITITIPAQVGTTVDLIGTAEAVDIRYCEAWR